ncbi:MAG TPA: hypothetical protein DD624_04315 [Alphaproteobacteria bacterium]|nr:hypothetical protein [Alphaproteobacteria bacterium]
MNKFLTALLLSASLALQGCAGFKAERLSTAEGDEKAMEITDEWLLTDTQNTVGEIMKKMDANRGFRNYLNELGHRPKLFIAEVQNETSEAYFPIDDMNDELLTQMSETGEFRLIDAAARDRILKEIRYQNEGMVKQSDIQKIGKQTGAELLIFGAVRMNPKTFKGKTIKEYTVNLRFTDITSGEEVARMRSTVSKYSKRSGLGW